MEDQELPSYTEYSEPNVTAIYNFLYDLPRSIHEVDPEDRPWLVEQLRDTELHDHYTTKFVSQVSDRLGSTVILKPATFLPKLATTLAIFWELDFLLLPDDQPDAQQALWLRSLQGVDPSGETPEDEIFRSTPLQLTLLFLIFCTGGKLH